MNFKQSFIAIYFIGLDDFKYLECREWVSFHLEWQDGKTKPNFESLQHWQNSSLSHPDSSLGTKKVARSEDGHIEGGRTQPTNLFLAKRRHFADVAEVQRESLGGPWQHFCWKIFRWCFQQWDCCIQSSQGEYFQGDWSFTCTNILNKFI